MRLGVLDIGSNTINLLVADVRPGGRPLGTTTERSVVRLMRYLQPDGSISEEGIVAMEEAVRRARVVAGAENVEELLTTATSAVREAANGDAVIARLEAALGAPLQVLPGDVEAQYTYLAARRWFGWAAGQILLFDIGGGSLEISTGSEETPDVARSLLLGAGRATVEFFPHDPPTKDEVRALRHHARAMIEPVAASMADRVTPDRVVGTSKAIRSLARLAGHSVLSTSGMERLILPRRALKEWIPRLAALPGAMRHELPGITEDRAYQIVAAAVIVHEAMRAFEVDELEVCPWALREGVLLRYIEFMSWAPSGPAR